MRQSKSLSWRSLPGGIGVEVDVDLSRRFDAETAAAWRQLFLAHHLLLVRNADIDEEGQLRIAAAFGRIVSDVADGSPVSYVSNTRPDGITGTAELAFHSDNSFCAEPFGGISFFALEVENERSSTRFVDAVKACRSMSAQLRERVEKLYARHLLNVTGRPLGFGPLPAFGANHPEALHPVIWRHPQSGQEILYVNELATSELAGLSPAESEGLLRELFDLLYAPKHQYEHRWRAGDYLIWDNYAMQHARGDLSAVGTRTLRRVAYGTRTFYEQAPEFAAESYTVDPMQQ
jgi:taurine dioxygenase